MTLPIKVVTIKATISNWCWTMESSDDSSSYSSIEEHELLWLLAGNRRMKRGMWVHFISLFHRQQGKHPGETKHRINASLSAGGISA